jgi:hypothetical protein
MNPTRIIYLLASCAGVTGTMVLGTLVHQAATGVDTTPPPAGVSSTEPATNRPDTPPTVARAVRRDADRLALNTQIRQEAEA